MAAKRSATNITDAALVAIVLFAPLPMASDRPHLWLAWTALILSLVALHPPRLAMPRSRSLRTAAFLGASTIVLAGVTTVIHVRPEGLLAILRWSGVAALLIVATSAGASRSRIDATLDLLVCAVAIHAVIALGLLAFGDAAPFREKTAYFGSATGGFVNRNAFAMFLSFGLVAGLAAAASRLPEHPVRRIGRLGALAAILLALLATQSRMGLLAALAGSAFALSQAGKRPRAIVLLACVVAATALAGQGLVARGLTMGSDVELRAHLYSDVFGMIVDRPLSGIGLDRFPLEFPAHRGEMLSPSVTFGRAHSTPLELWAELGLVAGSLPLAAATLVAIHIHRSRTRSPRIRRAALAALVVAALQGSVDFGLAVPPNAYLLAILVGLGIGASVGGTICNHEYPEVPWTAQRST